MSTNVSALIVAAAQAAGIDPSLATEVAIAESGMNQDAVSSAGAVGVMQLEPSSFPGVDVTDLQTNITTGVNYLAQLLGQFDGNVVEALAAYNWGPGNVSAAISQYGSDCSTAEMPAWLVNAPQETINYVTEIIGALSSEYTVCPTPSASASSSTPASNVGTTPTGTSAVSSAGVPTTGVPTWAWFVAAGLGVLMLWGMTE